MARIAGVNIAENKRVEIAITTIYGIGRSLSKQILKDLNIDFNKKVNEINNEDFEALRKKIEEMRVEGELKMATSQDIKRLKEIGTYRGKRHFKNLPARG